MAGGEEAFAEVTGHDLFFVADASQVHAGVPALKHIDVRRYILQLGGGEDSGFRGASRLGMTRFG